MSSLVIVCLGAVHARASEPPLVLVVGRSDDPLVDRVQKEVALMGYRTESLPRTTDWLEAAKARAAVGVVEVDPARHEVVLWTLDASPTGQLASRDRVASGDPQVLALQSVELLHCRLAPVDASPSGAPAAPPSSSTPETGPPAPAASPVATSATEASRTRPRPFAAPFAAFIGPALTAGRGGVPPLLGPRVALGYRPHPHVELGATALLPPQRATVSVDLGHADVTVLAAGATARVGWRAGAFVLDAGLGLLLQRGVAATLSEQQQHTDSRSARWSLREELGGGFTWLATERVGLRLLGTVGGVTPPLEVLEVGSPAERATPGTAARFTGPVVSAALGVEVGLGPTAARRDRHSEIRHDRAKVGALTTTSGRAR